LNLRAAPRADSQVVDWLLTGQTVIATSGESAGWRAVRNWAGAKGYVNVKWLECGK
jgi:SH3-like domain-containing protein